MTTIYLAVEGCHGTGTSTHADAIASALRADGLVARAYHHPRHPDGCTGPARVAWYAGARAQLAAEQERLAASLVGCGDDLPRVVVMDRGPWSGVVHARSLYVEPSRAVDLAMREVASEPWRSAPMVVLDAAADVLDARLRERGEDPAASHAERCEWAQIDARRVCTDRDVAVVRAELLAWARGVIQARRAGR